MRRRHFEVLALVMALGAVSRASADVEPGALEAIQLPPGFHIALYTDKVPGARSLTQGPSGVVFVGTRSQGTIYAVLPGRDQKADRVLTFARGLDTPNGVAFRGDSLYVAEVSRILRFDGIAAWLGKPEGKLSPVVVRADLPKDRSHGWKFIRFGPDGWLYVPIGAPCNVCEENDPRYASITRMKPDGGTFEIFARGIRNSVGFDWQPGTRELWFTDNGRDMLGDEVPPDELNRAPRQGLQFGFPYCHGSGIPDPEFGKGHPCSQFTPPAMLLGPHVAALGMRFYTGTMFPPRYRGAVFIAEHGSWNRRSKLGYRVSVVRVQGSKAVSYDTFAGTWLQGQRTRGRPVDVEVMPDGALLISDDDTGALYRIWYAASK